MVTPELATQEEAAHACDVCRVAAWSFWERGLLSTFLEAGFDLATAQAYMTRDDWNGSQEVN